MIYPQITQISADEYIIFSVDSGFNMIFPVVHV